MRWKEPDLESGVWTVPAARIESWPPSSCAPVTPRRCDPSQIGNGTRGNYVFPGDASDKPLSNTAIGQVLRRMKIDGATVHGFRSSFRDWAGNCTNFPREVVETALAHVIGDRAEQAYRRSDALAKRRKLMEAWAAYCSANLSEKVVPFRTRRRAAMTDSRL